MAFTAVIEAFPIQFESGFGNEYQQLDKRVAKHFKAIAGNSSETMGIDTHISKKEAVAVTTRFTNYTPTEENADRSWLSSLVWDVVSWIPEDDDVRLAQVGSYKGAIMVNHMAAISRLEDAELLKSAFGPAKRGLKVDAAVDVPFDTANQSIAVDYRAATAGTELSFTLSKLDHAVQKFQAAEVPDGPGYVIVINSAIAEDLKTRRTAYNNDHDGLVSISSTGRVVSYNGIPVEQTELLPEAAAGTDVYSVLIAQKASIVRSIINVKAKDGIISHEAPLSAYFIKTRFRGGSVRVRDKGVIQVLAKAGGLMTDTKNPEW